MPYFAAALARTPDGWTARELDLDDVDDLDGAVELLRDLLAEEGGGPALLLREEDDEHLAVVRVDGDAGDPRVFLSDRRAVESGGVTARLWDVAPELVESDEDDDDEEESVRPVAEPAGDASLLSDLGTNADELLALCSEKGALPADVSSAVAERAGALDALDAVRGA